MNKARKLFEFAEKEGFNKIALGHHMDDILVTFLMNLTFEGSRQTIKPILKLEHYPLSIIRPLCLVPEAQIQAVLKEGKLTPKVIIPVDLFGQPADYNLIVPLAEHYGLKILEDAAQGFGGSINGKKACSFGEFSATSFFPAKPLGCYGDGGAIFTDDDEADARLRSLRASGKSPEDKYDNREIGMNSRLDTLQAAILIPKLKAFADYELDAVNAVAKRYTAALGDYVITPFVPHGFVSSWAQYTILLDNAEQRGKVQAALKEKGIPSMIYYPRGLHMQKAYAQMNLSNDLFPNTLSATQRVLSLPMHPYLTDEDQQLVIEALIDSLKP